MKRNNTEHNIIDVIHSVFSLSGCSVHAAPEVVDVQVVGLFWFRSVTSSDQMVFYLNPFKMWRISSVCALGGRHSCVHKDSVSPQLKYLNI